MSVDTMQVNFKTFFTNGRIEYIYEDDLCVAFDATKHQVAPTHFLVVPKKCIPRLCQASPEDEKILGHLFIVAERLAAKRKLGDYHVVVDEDHRTMTFNGVHLFGRIYSTGLSSRL